MNNTKFSYVSAATIIFVICLCAAIGISASAYIPLREYRTIAAACDRSTTAYVYAASGQNKDDVYYYGPKIAYHNSVNGNMVRTEIVNTVKLTGKNSWKKDTPIAVKYSSKDASLVIFDPIENNPAEKNFKNKTVLSAAVAAAGLLILVAAMLYRFVKSRPVKYKRAPDGSTFEEWQQKKIIEEQTATMEEVEIPEENDENGKF